MKKIKILCYILSLAFILSGCSNTTNTNLKSLTGEMENKETSIATTSTSIGEKDLASDDSSDDIENASTSADALNSSNDTVSNSVSISTINSFSQEELLQIATSFSNNEVYGSPIYADFNGDGREDLIIEGGKEIANEGYGERIQYFVFTDGENSFKFAEKDDASFLYSTDVYILDVSNKKLLIINTGWRPAALAGFMQRSEIYSFDTEAHCLFDKDFTEITGVDPSRELAYVNYYEVPTPGSFLKDKGILWYSNDQIFPIRGTTGISDDYKHARIKPQKDPRNVWKDQPVNEITGLWGIHFYIPDNWTISCGYWDYPSIDNTYYYATDDQGNEGSVISTYVCSKNFQFDFGIDGHASYILGSDDQYDYYFRMACKDEFEPEYDVDSFFPEFSAVSEKILKTAWVE